MKQLCLIGMLVFSFGMVGCGNQYKGLLGHDEDRDEREINRDVHRVHEIEKGF